MFTEDQILGQLQQQPHESDGEGKCDTIHDIASMRLPKLDLGNALEVRERARKESWL